MNIWGKILSPTVDNQIFVTILPLAKIMELECLEDVYRDGFI